MCPGPIRLLSCSYVPIGNEDAFPGPHRCGGVTSCCQHPRCAVLAVGGRAAAQSQDQASLSCLPGEHSRLAGPGPQRDGPLGSGQLESPEKGAPCVSTWCFSAAGGLLGNVLRFLSLRLVTRAGSPVFLLPQLVVRNLVTGHAPELDGAFVHVPMRAGPLASLKWGFQGAGAALMFVMWPKPRLAHTESRQSCFSLGTRE